MARHRNIRRLTRLAVFGAAATLWLGAGAWGSAQAMWTYDYVSGSGWVTYNIGDPFHAFLLSYCVARPGMCF